jgi:hypothetical protein
MVSSGHEVYSLVPSRMSPIDGVYPCISLHRYQYIVAVFKDRTLNMTSTVLPQIYERA